MILEVRVFVFDVQMSRHRLSGIPCFGNMSLSGNTVRRAGVGASSSDTFISGGAVNAMRPDHKVVMPSSSLAAIPEGAATSVLATTSAGNVSAISAPSAVLTPTTVKSSTPGTAVRTSGGPSATVISGAVSSTSTVTSPLPNQVASSVDGRSSSPKHSTSVVSGGTNRTPAPEVATVGTLSSKGPRQLFVVRHGERIDFTFGKDWIQNSFNAAGMISEKQLFRSILLYYALSSDI